MVGSLRPCLREIIRAQAQANSQKETARSQNEEKRQEADRLTAETKATSKQERRAVLAEKKAAQVRSVEDVKAAERERDEEIKKAEQMCSPEFNPEPWAEWRERLNKWSGGIDTYQEIHRIAREVPADMKAENVEPRRWWRTA